MTELETEQHRAAWRVIAAVMPGSEFVSHGVELNEGDWDVPRLQMVIWDVTAPHLKCSVCGEPPTAAGFTTKCRDRHEVCQCGERFDQPKGEDCKRYRVVDKKRVGVHAEEVQE